MLPWAKEHFKKHPWTFQQDSAPSHGAKKTQEWLSVNVPNFISKEKWPPSSPDLNPLDFGIWGYLESKVSATHHKSLEALTTKLQKEWSKMPQGVIRDSCRSFSRRLQLVNDSNGSILNKLYLYWIDIHSVTIFHLCYSNCTYHFPNTVIWSCNAKYWSPCILSIFLYDITGIALFAWFIW